MVKYTSALTYQLFKKKIKAIKYCIWTVKEEFRSTMKCVFHNKKEQKPLRISLLLDVHFRAVGIILSPEDTVPSPGANNVCLPAPCNNGTIFHIPAFPGKCKHLHKEIKKQRALLTVWIFN